MRLVLHDIWTFERRRQLAANLAPAVLVDGHRGCDLREPLREWLARAGAGLWERLAYLNGSFDALIAATRHMEPDFLQEPEEADSLS